MTTDSPRHGPERVVILGGGVGGVTAAFALTQPEMAGRYEVTLYQMGWRLGGKGASGRNPDAHQRIEEHGLHIWLGFYYNAFACMRQCYRELGRDPAAPLGTFEKAFVPQDLGTLMDDGIDGNEPWQRWDIEMPRTSDTLLGGEQPSALGYLEMMLQWIAEVAIAEFKADAAQEGLLHALWNTARLVVVGGATLIHDALHIVRKMRKGESTAEAAREVVIDAAGHAQDYVHRLIADPATQRRRRSLAQVVDIACATIKGLYAGGILTEGKHFQSLDDRGLLEYLREQGCAEASLDSPLLRGYFALAFGYKRGRTGEKHENAAAGTAILAILRVCFEYRGSFMWRMAAGMGDTIFGPYYEVLKRRGVKFKFFHRVTALEAGTDPATGAPRVERVHLSPQVRVKGGEDAYAPLVDVKGLPCWPSFPLYDQIENGDALKQAPNGRPFDLESMWSGWSDVGPPKVLTADDFDHLVLAIPVGAHPILCADLMKASERFRTMVEKVQTVQTFGVQLWLDREVQELGWSVPWIDGAPQRAVCDAYADPLNSFADNSHLITMEDWHAPAVPKTLLYFCGPLADELPPLQYPPPEDTGFPQRQHRRVKEMAIAWFEENTRAMLPGASPHGSPGLDWARLVDTSGGEGVARFDAQFWGANIDPSERYVLSVAGSTKHRLAADDSQFTNLVLAGDWVDNGFAVGCVESATLGGLQAARAITGGAHSIYGEPIYGDQTMEAGRYGASRRNELPAFVPELSNLELPPPYSFRKLTIRSFPVLADPVRLQQAVARLNIAPPEVCEVQAVGNLVFMQLAQYPYLQSEPDPEGWFTENELSFNILVAIGKRVNGQFVPSSLAYYFPFIYVDNDWAIATGREVFGYQKIGSEMTFGAAGDSKLFGLTTLALPQRGSNEQARKVELVQITETVHRSGFDALMGKIGGMAGELGDMIFGAAGFVDQSSLGLVASLLKTFGREQVGIVSLKQFRDAAQPSRACYQSIVLTSFTIDKWHRLDLLPGDYAARITREASMPIVETLGLQVGADGLVKTMQPFAMEYDCTVSVGTNLYVAR